jgi:hypothetical protein
MNIFKKLFSKKKQPISEHLIGMSKIKKYSDGSFELSINKKPGSFNGLHYTEYVEQVKQLKREKKHQEAINLLIKLVEAIENESKIAGNNWGVAPWYYEQLAILYRKEKQYQEEVAILERYMIQPKAPGIGSKKLEERLKKAKGLIK